MKRHTLAAAAALMVLVPWHEAIRAEAPTYTIENLGTFNGEVPVVAGVNAAGQVVGNVTANGSQAVRYTNGTWEALPNLDGFSVATGINNAGDVVGYRATGDGVRAFRYTDTAGKPEDIAPLAGGSMTLGFGINDDGVVVGLSDAGPFRQSTGLDAEALPSLGGGFGYGCGINNAGTVAGISLGLLGTQSGMRIDNGAASAIALSSPAGDGYTVTTCAISEDGFIGGQADLANGDTHAVRFAPDGSVLDLDTFGSSFSNVESIAGGVSVGWYTTATEQRAFAHRDEDGSFDLNSRIDAEGWVLNSAKGVTADGVIAGQGTFDGAPAAFLLRPVAQAADTTAPSIVALSATPSSITPANGHAVNVTVTVQATDNSGDAPVCALTQVSGGAAGSAAVTGPLSASVKAVGGRTYTLHVGCADAAGNTTAATVDVVVPPDTTAPDIENVDATPDFIWPANGKWVSVSLDVDATDDSGLDPVCGIDSVSGGQASDAAVTGRLSVKVRAEKDHGGTARVYVINVTCRDHAGNASQAMVTVTSGKDTPAYFCAYNRHVRAWIWRAALHRAVFRLHR